MPQTDEGQEWAKQLTLAAFTECGVRLREGDSLILVAAVFRRVLEAWSVNQKALMASQASIISASGARVADLTRAAIAEEFGAQASRLRTELLKDAESASALSLSAVKNALGIPERKNLWRARAEGLFAGAILVLFGAFLMHWLSR